jgi:hypothetical protein
MHKSEPKHAEQMGTIILAVSCAGLGAAPDSACEGRPGTTAVTRAQRPRRQWARHTTGRNVGAARPQPVESKARGNQTRRSRGSRFLAQQRTSWRAPKRTAPPRLAAPQNGRNTPKHVQAGVPAGGGSSPRRARRASPTSETSQGTCYSCYRCFLATRTSVFA